ncbi:MAG TPA: hypothetical protein VJV78_27520, partial [Polyangiales bacterium]|nr:hypothetical protein [Polyangiales bacterium]
MLLIGSGVLADSLAKALAGQGVGFERAPVAQAASTARALAPDLMLLAGDAANDRGAAVLGQLGQAPALVICAPEVAGLAPQTPTPRHVGYLPPEGGVTECARRVRALIELFSEEGLATCSMQQFADTVSSRAQASPTTIKVSIPTKPATPSAASAPRPKITLQGATVSASPTAVSAKAPPATAAPTSTRGAIARANPAPAAPQTTAAARPAAAAPAQAAPAIQPQPAQAKSVAKPAPIAQAAAPSVAVSQPAKPEPKKTAPI